MAFTWVETQLKMTGAALVGADMHRSDEVTLMMLK
jgi:hypothetical protein